MANSTTTVIVSPSTVTVGADAKISVKVTGSSGTPTGSAALYVDGVNVGGITLSGGSGSTEAPSNAFSNGTHSIGVIYSGDATYGDSLGYSSLKVNFLTSTTSLAASTTSLSVGQTITLTATVAGSGATPTGKVNFSVIGDVIGSATLSKGVAALTASTNGEGAGSYPVVATYVGSSPLQPILILLEDHHLSQGAHLDHSHRQPDQHHASGQRHSYRYRQTHRHRRQRICLRLRQLPGRL